MSANAPAERCALGARKISVPISFPELSRLQSGRLRLLALGDAGFIHLYQHVGEV
jgi:hypothetical protein